MLSASMETIEFCAIFMRFYQGCEARLFFFGLFVMALFNAI